MSRTEAEGGHLIKLPRDNWKQINAPYQQTTYPRHKSWTTLGFWKKKHMILILPWSLRTFDWTSQTRLEYNHLLEPSIKYSVFLPPSIKTLLISAVCLLLCHPFAVQPLEQVANDFSATLSVHHGSLINTPCVYTHLGKAAKVHHHAFLQVSAIHSKCFQSSCSLCLTILPYIVSSPLHCGLHGLFHFLLSHQAARTWTYKCSFELKNEEAHRCHVTGFKMNTAIFLPRGCVWFLQLMQLSNKNPKCY